MSNQNADALRAARDALARKRLEGTMETLDPLERSVRSPQSLDLAIKATCFECQGRDEPGSQTAIAGCDAWTCALWQFRPYQSQAAAQHGAAERPVALSQLQALRDTSPLRAAAERQESRRRAINAKCYDCAGGDKAKETKQGVAQCASRFPAAETPDGYRGCPLWPHRPWQAPDAGAQDCPQIALKSPNARDSVPGAAMGHPAAQNAPEGAVNAVCAVADASVVVQGISGRRVDERGAPVEVANEAEHFYRCADCGQAVDMRDLGAVLHHEQTGHGPIRPNS